MKSGRPAPSTTLSPLRLAATTLPAQSIVALPPSLHFSPSALPEIGLPNQPSNKRKSATPLLHSPQSKRLRITDSPAGSMGDRWSPSPNDLDLSSPYLGSSYGPMSSPHFGSYGPMFSPYSGPPSAASSSHSSPIIPTSTYGMPSAAGSFSTDLSALFPCSPSQYMYPGDDLLPLLPPHPDAYNELDQEQPSTLYDDGFS